jgi:TrmH family RNA methyltransferase
MAHTYKSISSLQNPIIKNLLLLQEKSKYRNEQQLFVIDGWKETKMALENGFELDTIFVLSSIDINVLFANLANQHLINRNAIQIIMVSENVFEKIAYRGNTSKVVSIAKSKKNNYNNILSTKNPLFLVIDGVEKPGNLGAILRIADAANVDAIFCADTKTDIFNPNVIRSSVGCVFTNTIIVDTKEAIYNYLRECHVSIFTTSLLASKNYLDCGYTQASAFVFGTEATGVDSFWENHATQNIIIPMRGQNDSLNVSNSVAVVVFEALRQRKA